MTAAVVAWLERDYDQLGAFRVPDGAPVHTPVGLFSAHADHRTDCHCVTGEGEIWTQADTVFKGGPSFDWWWQS